jgi:hypothetical protein
MNKPWRVVRSPCNLQKKQKLLKFFGNATRPTFLFENYNGKAATATLPEKGKNMNGEHAFTSSDRHTGVMSAGRRSL